jgi:hypothetical protein
VWEYIYDLGRDFYSIFGGGMFNFDEVTGALTTIDLPHHEVHEGEMFAAYYNSTTGTAADVLLTTGATSVHLVIELVSDGKVKTTIYEGPTTSANGTAITAVNKNRQSINTAVLTVHHTPTVSATGTAIHMYMVGSAAKAGGIGRSVEEYILAKNTKYLLRSAFAVNTDVLQRFTWYEET